MEQTFEIIISIPIHAVWGSSAGSLDVMNEY